MNTTKQVLAFYERDHVILEKLENAVHCIKADGIDDDHTRTVLRALITDLNHHEAAVHFYDAWYEEEL